MDWRDAGIVLGVRRLGETSVVLELMTRDHGRHLGLVHGGRSRRQQPVLQAGNSVEAVWRARLDEQLGTFTVEATRLRTAQLLANAPALHAATYATTLLRTLAEREPHLALHATVETLLDTLDRTPSVVAQDIVWLEVGLLAELGFGLDLSVCALTGATDDLAFVSPRTGRAVTRTAASRWADRLLRLPPILIDRDAIASPDDLSAAFALTGHFLERDVFGPRGLPIPPSRLRLLADALTSSEDQFVSATTRQAGSAPGSGDTP